MSNEQAGDKRHPLDCWLGLEDDRLEAYPTLEAVNDRLEAYPTLEAVNDRLEAYPTFEISLAGENQFGFERYFIVDFAFAIVHAPLGAVDLEIGEDFERRV